MASAVDQPVASHLRLPGAANPAAFHDLVARYRSDRTLARLLGFFLMAHHDLVALDALARPLEIGIEALGVAAQVLECDGFLEREGNADEQVCCRLTRSRRGRSLARELLRVVERRPR